MASYFRMCAAVGLVLMSSCGEGQSPVSHGGGVDVIGRYNFDRQHMKKEICRGFFDVTAADLAEALPRDGAEAAALAVGKPMLVSSLVLDADGSFRIEGLDRGRVVEVGARGRWSVHQDTLLLTVGEVNGSKVVSEHTSKWGVGSGWVQWSVVIESKEWTFRYTRVTPLEGQRPR
jgi:hypothetical protein